MGILEGEEREKGAELFETIMMRISPKLMSDIKPQFQEVQRILKSTPMQITFKLWKN